MHTHMHMPINLYMRSSAEVLAEMALRRWCCGDGFAGMAHGPTCGAAWATYHMRLLVRAANSNSISPIASLCRSRSSQMPGRGTSSLLGEDQVVDIPFALRRDYILATMRLAFLSPEAFVSGLRRFKHRRGKSDRVAAERERTQKQTEEVNQHLARIDTSSHRGNQFQHFQDNRESLCEVLSAAFPTKKLVLKTTRINKLNL